MYKRISLLICILWMGFIFYNSSQDGSQSNGLSYRIIDKIISIEQKIKGNDNNCLVYSGTSSLNNNVRVTLNLDIRKIAHGFEYFILSVLVANAYFSYNIKGRNVIINILFIVLFYAVTDEYHQLYVKGRNSSVEDIIIDFVGGIIGMIIFYTWYYLTYRKGMSAVKKR